MADGRESRKIKINEIGINATFILPKCPASLGIVGGGAIPVKTLPKEALLKIAEAWKEELFRLAEKP